MKAAPRKYLVVAVVCLLFAAVTQAQNYPVARPVGSAPDSCGSCAAPLTGLPTYPFPSPLKRFAGRYVDSQGTRDYQQPLRTLRGRSVKIAPAQDRVYMIMGSSFLSYSLSGFFGGKLGTPVTAAPVSRAEPTGTVPSEQWLAPDGYFYAEKNGWTTPIYDGQDRLYAFDYDDRGNVYLAYFIFGWGILKDTGGLTSQKQVLPDRSVGAPTQIGVLKGGSKYYAFVFSDTKGGVYDSTIPTTPSLVANFTYGSTAMARTDDFRFLATSNNSKDLRIFDGATVSPMNPSPSFTITGSNISSVSSDGRLFYYVDQMAQTVGVVDPATGQVTATFNIATADSFRPDGIHASPNHFVVWGSDAAGFPAAHLYKIVNGAAVDMGITDYLHKYYNAAPSGYAHPSSYLAIHDALFYSGGGKNYFFYSSDGLGDVYEVQDGDNIDISVNRAAGFGTRNNNSPTAGTGPFYGDIVRFTTTGTGQAATAAININFGNPESSDNTSAQNVGTVASHQYSGISSASGIAAPKQIMATGTTDTSLSSSVALTLLAPVARVSLPASGVTLSSGQAVTAPIVPGDSFVDASDGAVEGHYASWNLDGSATNRTPLEAHPAGATCGAHTLNFSAAYVPYSGSAGSITPRAGTAAYNAALGAITYTVKPFGAKVQIASSTSSTITFQNAGRTATAAAFAPNADWTTTWELLDASNQALLTQATTQAISSPVPTFSVNKGTGSKVRLTLSMAAASIVDATCATMNSDSSTFALIVPDVRIDVAGCAHVGDPCTLTANSISGLDQTGWSYQWVNGSATASGRVYSPVLSSPGTYTISVTATNPVGSSNASSTMDVAQQTCAPFGAQDFLSISAFPGNSVNSGTSITLNPGSFFTSQPCDIFSWNLGDGTTAATRSVDHVYADGNFTATLTVSRNGATKNAQVAITVGAPAPPPPPPGGGGGGSTTCPTTAPSNVFPNWTGPTSGCTTSKPCEKGEAIAFSPQAFPYTIQSCDTFSWTFGDGSTSSGKNASHIYAATGSFPVKLTVVNAKGTTTSAAANLTVVAGSGGTGGGTCAIPGATTLASITYSGATSQCSAGSGSTSNCVKNENIAFSTSTFNYNIQSCDTFAWTFGDGTTSSLQSPTHQYTADGPYNVTLTISTSGGKTLTAQVAVKVGNVGGGGATPVPTVTLSSSSTTASVNTVLTFTASATPSETVTAWSWNFGDGSIEVGQNVMQHAYKASGTYDVQVRATNAGGQSAPSIQRVVITPGTAFSFILPVVGHFNGNLGTKWRSDVQIFNPTTEPMTLSFEFKGSRGFKRDVVIDSSTRVYEDILKTMAPYLFVDTPGCVSGTDQSCGEAGPMIVSGTSSKTPQIWTRTYTVSQTGVGTFGQQIPAVPIASSQPNGAPAASYIIAGVENSSKVRTNLGLVNPSATPLTVTVTATADAFLLGEFSVTIPAYQFTQIGDLNTRVASKGKPYSLRVTPATNSPVVAYASMIDNISNDPVYIPGTADTAQTSDDMKAQFIPGVGHLLQANGTWRSDVTIFNPDSRAVMFTAKYFDSTGAKIAEVKDQPLAPNTFLRVDDVIRWPLFTTQPPDSFGVLTVETTTASVGKYPIVTSRTYKDRGEFGSYGQGIIGTPIGRPNVKAGTPAYIAGVRSDLAYYTNLGIISLGIKPTDVLVSLLDKTTGQVVGTWRRTYADGKPNPLFSGESLIARDILRALSATADSGTLKIEVVGDGDPIWAYASIIDQTTSDPEYVAAAPLN